jgi:hypothetical protein
MDLIIELQDLPSTNWFSELSSSLVSRADLDKTHVSLVQPAPGTFGAVRTKKLKAVLTTASELATILTLAVALYPAPNKDCTVRFTNGPTHVEIVVPCQVAPSQEEHLVTSIVDALAKFRTGPPSIQVMPLIAK